jgi:hypothetical protein
MWEISDFWIFSIGIIILSFFFLIIELLVEFEILKIFFLNFSYFICRINRIWPQFSWNHPPAILNLSLTGQILIIFSLLKPSQNNILDNMWKYCRYLSFLGIYRPTIVILMLSSMVDHFAESTYPRKHIFPSYVFLKLDFPESPFPESRFPESNFPESHFR